MAEGPKKISVQWPALFGPIQGFDTDVENILEIEREVIPIVFVPGIMGSRLKVLGRKKNPRAWDPDGLGFMVWNYGMAQVTAGKRKALLVGSKFDKNYLAVFEHSDGDHDDKERKHREKYEDFPGAGERGWGEVSWRSYGKLLMALQLREWSEPIRHCFELPVHAVGYNWTASSDDSGQRLQQRIREIIDGYKQRGRLCEHVILVTHSMGGLVARSACKLHGAESQVLGVLHGVQPSRGAAAAYWRMKSGFERPNGAPAGTPWSWMLNPLKLGRSKIQGIFGTAGAMTLGVDGEEVTALLANIPGGLELLPTPSYTDNTGAKGWLKYPDLDGTTVVTLPRQDVYEEIYRQQYAFYRLVEPEWLPVLDRESESEREIRLSVWNDFLEALNTARGFHSMLGEKIHTETVQFYAEGLNTADSVQFGRALNTLSTKVKRLMKDYAKGLPWQGTVAAAKVALGANPFSPAGLAVSGVRVLVKDSDRFANWGGFRVYTDASDRPVARNSDDAMFVMTIEPPGNQGKTPGAEEGERGGDGTVPLSSASALAARETIRIGEDEESWLDRDHEGIYRTETGQHIAMAAIENFCLKKIKDKTGKGG